MDATSSPDRVGIVFDTGDKQDEFTIDGFDRWISGIAAGLRDRYEVGTRIGILGANHPAHLAACFGAIRAGMVAAPINPELKTKSLEYIVEDAEIALLVVDATTASRFESKIPKLLYDDINAIEHASARSVETFAAHKEDLAFIMYTSGSTGEPKGVPITHSGYLWAIEKFHFFGEFLRNESSLIAAPLFHMNGQFHIMSTLAVGGTAILLPSFDARRFLRAIERHRVLRLTGVPTMFELIMRDIEAGWQGDLESVKSIAMGSSPVSDTLLDRLSAAFPYAHITNGYGTTEIGPATFGPHPEGLETPAGSVGYPFAGVEMKLSDQNNDNIGELSVRSPMVAKQYLNKAEMTAKKFNNGWYQTGDLMRRDEQGFYYFTGRVDDMFVCGGENIYPGEVEQRILTLAGVNDTAVVAMDDAIKGRIPVAFVVRDDRLTEEDIKSHCLEHGPAYAHPRFVGFLSKLPLTSVKKVDRKELEKEAVLRFGGLR